jgi:undecaprenyl-diphosphatase
MMRVKPPVVLICLSMMLFIILAALMATGTSRLFDLEAAARIQALESEALTLAMVVISALGDWYIYAPVALMLFLLPKTRISIGFPMIATLMASSLLNTILKLVFSAPRPSTHRLIPITGFSFPSGHAMNCAAFIGFAAAIFIKRTRSLPFKCLATVLALLFIVAVGFSRVYLGVHNPIDVLAGYSAGFFVCALSLVIFKDDLA